MSGLDIRKDVHYTFLQVAGEVCALFVTSGRLVMKKADQLTLFATHPSLDPDDGHKTMVSSSEQDLLALAVALGARSVPGWSSSEDRIVANLPVANVSAVAEARRLILNHADPLGDRFCVVRSSAERRKHGATFTPGGIVRSMVDWARTFAIPDRVVDPGIGSGRFLIEAGRRFPDASLIGVELDPIPSILARANLAVHGLADRSEVIHEDYRHVSIGSIPGRTLYIGNPPYVRHHLQEPHWKEWLIRQARTRGLPASQLAGMHIHFFMATVLKAKPGDFGTFITAAEWLDVNYGSLLRDLFLGDLGGRQIVVIEPTALPFADAATTAAITSFEVGSRPESVCLKRINTIDDLAQPDEVHEVPRERMEVERRWSHLTRPARKDRPGYVELGDLCRVHRGQVTGSNRFWIAGPHSLELPETVLYSSVTKARELFRAGGSLDDDSNLRKVIDLPPNFDRFDAYERSAIHRFLKKAEGIGINRGYVAANRKAWWSVGLRDPAPILATYMARRPPAFVRNRAGAYHINIAHGLYPHEPLSEPAIDKLIQYLATQISMNDGRTYAGGLTKFEPREMERLLVPGRDLLERRAE